MHLQFTLSPKDLVRFWSKVDKDGPVVRSEFGQCWLWRKPLTQQGYGQFYFGGRVAFRTVPAHRVSYELTYGPFDPHLNCCHRCDIPGCVRPEHLFLGTQMDNIHDQIAKGRATFQVHPDQARRVLKPKCIRHGEQTGSNKLTATQVLDIRARFIPRVVTLKQLAEEYGVSYWQISEIVTRHAWAHLP